MGDYSSWFCIYNRLNTPLKWVNQAEYSGCWKVQPPNEIPGHSTSRWIQLKDNFGDPHHHLYQNLNSNNTNKEIDSLTHTLQIKIKCPTGGEPNYAPIWVPSEGANPPLATGTSVSPTGQLMTVIGFSWMDVDVDVVDFHGWEWMEIGHVVILQEFGFGFGDYKYA
ncbi:hypothetical protein BO94DRAFT_600847 [Aspergillus sclerotioniger CBS 115572]|uniref:Uncharacterized protein n=1 Tax=Aspergillus sclerotioniger CBS 115572 TaxID=1450535 RepID=A0A317XE82_9EURO|nr:hypothetical protein BO94DRAFT_600847 [Aspergillus sclerotioniger CBS 115572]PWY95937.1 hypothetical protein BO94DRAFT_600847 [Aspergillus sclerotioniger CBS 115572]